MEGEDVWMGMEVPHTQPRTRPCSPTALSPQVRSKFEAMGGRVYEHVRLEGGRKVVVVDGRQCRCDGDISRFT